MSLFKHGRYSGYLRPISYVIDLCIINLLAILFYFTEIDGLQFVLIISLSWIVLSIYSKFYEVYRYTREIAITTLIFRQLVLFALIIFAFSGFYHDLNLNYKTILKYVFLEKIKSVS